MNLSLVVSLLSGAFLSYLLMILFGYFGHKKEGERYSLLSYFPFELFKDSRGVYYSFARIFEAIYLLLFLSGPSLFLYRYSSYGNSLVSYYAFLLMWAVVSSVSFFVVSLLPPSHEKAHFTWLFAFAASSTTLFTMEGFNLFNLAKSSTHATIAYVFGALLLLLALGMIAPLFNPKLSHWAEMDHQAETDGTISLKRPRPFVLAFSEWMLSLISFVGFVLSLIAYYLL
jgi:hypothetical protein